jgi:hypothetical protein
MTKRLLEIIQKNIEFEKESPYNFCDRWCERCVHERQIRCTLYKDEMERRLTCIAHGRDENDPEITKAVLEEQCKDIDEKLGEQTEKIGMDIDCPDIDESGLNEDGAVDFEDLPPEVQKHIRFVENNTLDKTARNYCGIAHAFLKDTFYKDTEVPSEVKYDFETVSRYHMLIPAKLHRALCGFHEPVSEGDISLFDAVAQSQICKKAITQSVDALRRIVKMYPTFQPQIQKMAAFLHNIHSRIEKMEESIG